MASRQRLAPRQRLLALALVAYACGFLLMMTLGAKKLDRYVLPLVPAHDSCEAYAVDQSDAEETDAPARPNPFQVLASLKKDQSGKD